MTKNEIATPSAPQKARNDSWTDCHCEERSDEAISKEIATGSRRKPHNDTKSKSEALFIKGELFIIKWR